MEDILHMDYQVECWSFLYVILIDLILVSIRFYPCSYLSFIIVSIFFLAYIRFNPCFHLF